MKTAVITLGCMAIILIGLNSQPRNVLPDGNVTEEEAKIMQEAWCDYNEGQYFAKSQCE